jgi:hypothetical protein
MPTRHLTFCAHDVDLVASGAKLQAVRRKASCAPGDTLALRRQYGEPAEIMRVECQLTHRVCIDDVSVTAFIDEEDGDVERVVIDREDFARADGFSCWADLVQHYRATYGLPFWGAVIYW